MNPDPHGLPPADLSSAFGRASALRGRLTPVSPDPDTATPSDEEQPQPAPAPEASRPAETPTPPAKASAPRRARRRAADSSRTDSRDTTPTPTPRPESAPAQPVSATSEGARRGIVIYTPVTVRDRLTAHRKNTNLTVTEILFDAFDDTHDQLADLYRAAAPQEQRPSLFERPATRRRAAADDPLVQTFVSMTARNIEILDRITATVAPNNTRARSRVAALALDAYLPPLPDDAQH